MADTSYIILSCCCVAFTPLWILASLGQLLCHCTVRSHRSSCACLYTGLPRQDGDITWLLFRAGWLYRVAGHVQWAPRSGWERREMKCAGGTATRRELFLSLGGQQALRKNRLDPDLKLNYSPSLQKAVTRSLGCLSVRALEKARSSAQLQTNYPSTDNSLYTNAKGSTISAFDGGSDSSSESEPEEPQSRKKLRMDS